MCEIQIVVDWRFLPISINVKSIYSAINDKIEVLKNMDKNCTTCSKNDIEKHLRELDAAKIDFERIVSWGETRRKRFVKELDFFNMFSAHKSDEILKNGLKISISNMVSNNLVDHERDIQQLKTKIKSLADMFRDKKLQKDVITTTELKAKISEIQTNLTENVTIPYSILEFYNVSLTIEDKLVNGTWKILLMHIPIVEKRHRPLLKVIHIPTRSSNGSFIHTSSDTRFVAVSNDSLMLFKDSCDCTQSNRLCLPMIQRNETTSCIAHAYQSGRINENLCQDHIKTYIKSNVEYEGFEDHVGNLNFWFYAPHIKNITETCKNITKNYTLFDSGIAKMNRGCCANINQRNYCTLDHEFVSDVTIKSVTINAKHAEDMHNNNINHIEESKRDSEKIELASVKNAIFAFLVFLIMFAFLYVWCFRRKSIGVVIDIDTLPRNAK
jgi:hypothetical protein